MGRALLPVVALSIASQPFAQVFGDASNQIPQGSPENASLTAEVDFADVDLDGDWDAAFANGPLADQNRLWINRGGIQGGALGFFVDETAVRFPAVNDTSRDIEFADWDGDGDPDIATSNGSFAQDEASRLWANTGGGFFADETSTRWVGLGGAGSSIDPALVPATGGFVDWCFDTDFADFDADGDLDLFHGTLAVPATPSRIFLNDGAGFFTEFNPAGIQLVGPGIPNGTPAIWAEGVHAQGTLQVDGSEADIAEPLFDVELADVDGDLDLDVLLGSSSLPRLFRSRREENGGTLSFRDVTHAVLPPGWANAGNSYDQELGDLDGDGDLDLYGASWQGFDDRTFVNTGGVFGSATPVPASASDDDEVDFIDYDNDGDLDVYVAGFSGVDRLYQNDNNGGSSFSLSLVGPGASGVSTDSSHDIDVCDVDLDGDYDVMTARDAPNQLLLNRTQIPDTTAPRVPLVEVVPNQIAGPAGVRVRAQVYDNAPDYVTASSDVRIEVTIAGCPHLEVPMRWSGGQVFRGEIPGDLVGWIEYRVRATDRYGNSGVSVANAYAASHPGTPVSFGVGSPGANGLVPNLFPGSVPFAHGGTLRLLVRDLEPSGPLFGVLMSDPLVPPFPKPGFATINVTGTLLWVYQTVADPQGCATIDIGYQGGLPPGFKVYTQAFGYPGTAGNSFSSSEGLEVAVQP